MTSCSRKTTYSQHVFDHAEQFRVASEILETRDASGQQTGVSLWDAAVVCKAFASELYLKSILAQLVSEQEHQDRIATAKDNKKVSDLNVQTAQANLEISKSNLATARAALGIAEDKQKEAVELSDSPVTAAQDATNKALGAQSKAERTFIEFLQQRPYGLFPHLAEVKLRTHKLSKLFMELEPEVRSVLSERFAEEKSRCLLSDLTDLDQAFQNHRYAFEGRANNIRGTIYNIPAFLSRTIPRSFKPDPGSE